MSTRQDTVDFILETLVGLDVSARKMFGEYALYCDSKVAAFVCDDTLFVKILPENKELAKDLQTGPCYPGSKDYYSRPLPPPPLTDHTLQGNLPILLY